MKRFLIALMLSWVWATGAFAVQPDEVLDDPVLEERARDLSALLRCMVCQNQSIDDSDAPLARDLRILVRERLTAGDSDEQVIDFLVARYGEFVLLQPQVNSRTYLLWFAPALLLLAGLFIVARTLRSRTPGSHGPEPLSAAEKKSLENILRDE